MIFRVRHKEKEYFVNAKDSISAVRKVRDGNILVRVVNRNGKLIETKRFPNREKLDNYVNSLENFYDMTKEKELYKNKYNEPDVQDVWTVVVSDSSIKDYSDDEYVKKLKEYKSGFVVIPKMILEKDGKNARADLESVSTIEQAKSLKAQWERWQPMPKGYVIVDCGNSYKIVE